MSVTKIESTITMLGNSSSCDSGKSYSLIEFQNGQILKSVDVQDVMDNFLQRAFKSDEKQTYWFKKVFFTHTLLGVKYGDKTYVHKSSIAPVIFFIALGIILLPFFFFGLYGFYVAYVFNKIRVATNEIINENPNAELL